MDLANQNQTRSALDNELMFNDQSVAPLKCSNDEYSIQLDPDTIKYLTAKRKPPMSVPQEDENDMRKIRPSNSMASLRQQAFLF